MRIQILSVGEEQSVRNGNKSYSFIEVAFKDESGKVQGKKLMSFGSPEVFNDIRKLNSGDYVLVDQEKNDKGYWEWVGLEKDNDNHSKEVNLEGAKAPFKPHSPNKVSSDRYETPEERAFRQRLIVRQSSLSNALEYLKLRQNEAVSLGEVLEVAGNFADWVFNDGVSPVADLESDDLY